MTLTRRMTLKGTPSHDQSLSRHSTPPQTRQCVVVTIHHRLGSRQLSKEDSRREG